MKNSMILLTLIGLLTIGCSMPGSPALSGEKSIREFGFDAGSNPDANLTADVAGLIGESDYSITIKVPGSARTENLVASFAAAPNAVVSVGGVEQSSGQTANDFSSPVVYSVRAQDGSVRDYTVTATPMATTKTITNFRLEAAENAESGLAADIVGIIDEASGTIVVRVPPNTRLSDLKPSFGYEGESVSVAGTVQRSGMNANNFENEVAYTVTAADGSTRVFTVRVEFLSSAKAITEFRFLASGNPNAGLGDVDFTADIDGLSRTISVAVPPNADRSSLVASFVADPGAGVAVDGTMQVSGETANNFESSVAYTVTAEDGSSQVYTVKVDPQNTAKIITGFRFELAGNAASAALKENVEAVVNQADLTISAKVPPSSSRQLVASFDYKGREITVSGLAQTSGSTLNDFSGPVAYKVWAEDGSSATYTVRVELQSSAKTISRFVFPAARNAGIESDVVADIDEAAGTITAKLPGGADKSALVATFTASAGATVKVGSALQISGSTANSFAGADGLVYTVGAEDGSAKSYRVKVLFTGKMITEFKFAAAKNASIGGTDIGAVIDESAGTITATFPEGADKSALVATFTASVGATVKVGSALQISGTTANSFAGTDGLVYTVGAEDGSAKSYRVKALLAGKAVTAFKFAAAKNAGIDSDVVADIDEAAGTITAKLPGGADKSALVATFTASAGATVKVGSALQISGTTANSFAGTDGLVYTVGAEDGSTKSYTVKVLRTGKAVTAFKFAAAKNAGIDSDVVADIDEAAGTITAKLPGGADKSALVATFTASAGATVKVGSALQISGTTANSFAGTDALVYTVGAEDGSTKSYTVKALFTAKKITEFKFAAAKNASLDGDDIGAVIDENAGTITAKLPEGTDKSGLVATFTAGAGATVKVGSAVQTSGTTANSFAASSGVAYTVVAEDGSTKSYTVKALFTGDEIIEFKFTSAKNASIGQAEVWGLIHLTERTIRVPVKSTTDLSGLVATFTTSEGASVKVGTAAQSSGATANDFSDSDGLVYTVTAEDGDVQTYTVYVTRIYEIGDTGPGGGKVFYAKTRYSDGWRYLEAAPTDLTNTDVGIAWGRETQVGGTSASIGTGKQNTARIPEDINATILGDYFGKSAAGLASDYANKGYDDWFLPSKDELGQMNTQRAVIGGFSGAYWSSTEHSNALAWQMISGSTPAWSNSGKTSAWAKKVRPIRAF